MKKENIKSQIVKGEEKFISKGRSFFSKLSLLLVFSALYFSCVKTEVVNAEEIKTFVGVELGMLTPGTSSNYKEINDSWYPNGKLVIGARNKYFGGEFFYQTTKEKSGSALYEEDEELWKAKTTLNAIGFDVNGYYTLNDKGVELFGGLGVAKYQIKIKESAIIEDELEDFGTAKEDKIAPRLTIGVQQSINDNIAISAALRYSPIGIKDNEGEKVLKDISEINVGVRYTF
jgi:opacity protein-like surface antigen